MLNESWLLVELIVTVPSLSKNPEVQPFSLVNFSGYFKSNRYLLQILLNWSNLLEFLISPLTSLIKFNKPALWCNLYLKELEPDLNFIDPP